MKHFDVKKSIIEKNKRTIFRLLKARFKYTLVKKQLSNEEK